MLEKLRSQSELVKAIYQYEHRQKGTIEQFKAVVQLADGSQLYINEVWVESKLKKYAYYWLTPTGKTLQGWDNAPHHPQIDSTLTTHIDRKKFIPRRYGVWMMYWNCYSSK